MWTITISGTPAPKGSLKCVGQRGRHQLIEDDPNGRIKPWRTLVGQAGGIILGTAGEPLTQGPLGVLATFTLERPKSIPAASRIWPWKKPDVDKLARTLLDGLTDSTLWGDDAQVVDLHIRKCYPHTMRCPDRLEAVRRRHPSMEDQRMTHGP